MNKRSYIEELGFKIEGKEEYGINRRTKEKIVINRQKFIADEIEFYSSIDTMYKYLTTDLSIKDRAIIKENFESYVKDKMFCELDEESQNNIKKAIEILNKKCITLAEMAFLWQVIDDELMFPFLGCNYKKDYIVEVLGKDLGDIWEKLDRDEEEED